MLAKLIFHLKVYQLALLILRLFPEAQILKVKTRIYLRPVIVEISTLQNIFKNFLQKVHGSYPYKDCRLQDHQELQLILLH